MPLFCISSASALLLYWYFQKHHFENCAKMLDFQWPTGNPPSSPTLLMLSPEDHQQPPHPHLHSSPAVLHHYDALPTSFADPAHPPPDTVPSAVAHHAPVHFDSFYDPQSYPSACHYALDPLAGAGNASEFMLVPKREEVSRIGLNLGGRTYFSSSEDDFVNRLYRRSRPGESGSANSPRCQAEGCNADLTHAKHYHRRHKVCEFHSKASTVVAAGLTQRFCQQCSRFHLLAEFDNGKRSCRKRLADHNRRRRKTQQSNHNSPTSHPPPETPSLIDTTAEGTPVDCGSSWSVTVAVSPPECLNQRPYNGTASSSSSGSLFFFQSG